jgi:hypothetical protein
MQAVRSPGRLIAVKPVVPFSGLTSWTTSFWLTLLRRTRPAST